MKGGERNPASVRNTISIMRWTPFSRPLGDLGPADIETVVVDKHEEGLFLEFKEQWTSKGVSRAVASFANMPDGGTVIVGIQEDPIHKRRAGSAVGFAHDSDPAESADNAIRGGVAPLPLYVPKAIRRKDGRWYLVIEVQAGLEPPYIHVQSGSVLIRTGTGSVPAQREELDRLYGQGIRGRTWALDEADQTLKESLHSPQTITLRTIPAVENGLPPSSRILTRSFYESLGTFLREPITEQYREMHPGQSATSISVYRSSHLYSASLSVDVGGTIQTFWSGLEDRLDLASATTMIERVLPQHQALLIGEFGHRGSVVVAMGAMGLGSSSSSIRLKRLCQVSDLSKNDFQESLVRDIRRDSGTIEFEPE